MRVVAVVVNWNGGEANVACLRSILAAGVAAVDVVFVDNGSSDGSRELVARTFPKITRIENKSNLGFGEAANQGAAAALANDAEAVFFVNNDVVLLPDTITRLARELARSRDVGIVGPRVLHMHDPSVVWCAGGMLTWRQNLSTLLGHDEPDGPRHREHKLVDYVPGCALMARRELLEEVGLFDARYFAYMEDVDLCLRASRRGYKVELVGDVAAHHASSSATGGGYNPRRKYMMGVNSIWFLRAHAGQAQWLRFLVFDVFTLPFAWLLGVFQGRGKSVLAKGVGIRDGLRGRRVTAEKLERGGSWMW
ncbi:MAG: glycosyltransferase family 2 protein [Planctomycetes bacterium]|nr:glycosyltransferase family 2 protein [Planctomycetota bacterium]